MLWILSSLHTHFLPKTPLRSSPRLKHGRVALSKDDQGPREQARRQQGALHRDSGYRPLFCYSILDRHQAMGSVQAGVMEGLRVG